MLYLSKLISCIVFQVFYFGFKCTRKFQKSLYIWDLIERAVVTTSTDKATEDGDTDDELDERDETSGGSFLLGQEVVDPVVWQSFVTVLSHIKKLVNIGKDEKVCGRYITESV